MMSRSRRLLALCVLATSVLSLIAAAAPASAGDKPVLARVKAATAACHDPVAAQAAGYIPTKTASRCPGWAGRDRSALGQPDADHRGPIIAGLPNHPIASVRPLPPASKDQPGFINRYILPDAEVVTLNTTLTPRSRRTIGLRDELRGCEERLRAPLTVPQPMR